MSGKELNYAKTTLAGLKENLVREKAKGASAADIRATEEEIRRQEQIIKNLQRS